MSESKKLNKRQLAVIEDLFVGDLEEKDILEKHGIRRHEYDRWLANERFAGQIQQRIAHAQCQSRILLARYATTAAAKLVQLTDCEKEETARKACLDIIAMNVEPQQTADANPRSAASALAGLAPETAGRLLAALARDRDGDVNPAP